jgi:hypothetical protein
LVVKVNMLLGLGLLVVEEVEPVLLVVMLLIHLQMALVLVVLVYNFLLEVHHHL